jgi:hypothetical protein
MSIAGAYRIHRVEPCGCLDHARVVLRADGCPRVSLRVDAATGHALAAGQSGLPPAGAAYVDILGAVLSAFGASCTQVECYPRSNPTRASLRIQSRDASGTLHPVPVGPALVLAARLGIPLVVPPSEREPGPSAHDAHGGPAPAASAAATVPEAFRAVIEALDLGD